MKALVTGGGGFVGKDLVRALLDRGDDVTVLELRGDSPDTRVRFLTGDVRDAECVREATRGQDVVFHTASLVHTKASRQEMVRTVNVNGARNVLHACQEFGVAKLVYVSSASVVYEGKDIEGGDESMPYSRVSQATYADSKADAERELLAANGEHGVAVCSLRPHVVFGPGDTRFLPAILERAEAGRLNFRIGYQDKLSDFTYVTNLTDALLAACDRLSLDSPLAGQAYFVTNGEPTAFWDFVSDVAAARGLPRPERRVPYVLAYAAAAVVEGIDTLRGGTLNAESGLSRFSVRYLCTHHYFRIDKARRDLDWEPKVSIQEGIALTMAALDEQRAAA